MLEATLLDIPLLWPEDHPLFEGSGPLVDALTPAFLPSEDDTAWKPQPGSQEVFLSCPTFECLYEGERGGGKTDCLIMAFAQHVGAGHGPDWRGVIFRKTYKQLRDVVVKTRKWFKLVWPKASFNAQEMTWTWPDGEQLVLSYMRTEADYDNHHGHNYPFVGWEELTTWATDRLFKLMFSCVRSAKVGVPLMVRSTTNPYGVGHNWVKTRYELPGSRGLVIRGRVDPDTGEDEPERVAINSKLSENVLLLRATPNYRSNIAAAAKNPSQAAAWLSGDWNIVAGGMFDDVWSRAHHVVPNFPASEIPLGWKVRRSYDHGSSRPFSVGWHLESDGTPIKWQGKKIGPVRGDVIRFMEWYGWRTGSRNEGLRMVAGEIADGIKERDKKLPRVRGGPADTNIFDDYEPGRSVAGDMRRRGIRWTRADKARKQGWEQCRTALKNAIPVKGVGRENPGFFVCQRCDQFIELIPSAPRDDDDLDDIDTDWEDHIADEWRYFMRRRKSISKVSSLEGSY